MRLRTFVSETSGAAATHALNIELGGRGGSRDGERGPLVRRRMFACLLGGAGFLPSINEMIVNPKQGLNTLYISPLKALANDIERNLSKPIKEMGLNIRVETRTGDTKQSKKNNHTEW